MTYFDVERYFDTLNQERERRGLTWSALTRELNAPFAHRPDIHPIATSTLTAMRQRSSLNGNIVVHTLMWLRRAPEEFTPGHPVAPVTLPPLKEGHLPRWNTAGLFEALDQRRASQRLSWGEAAARIGEFTPDMLKSLRKSVGFPRVMRVLAWLDRPAADFVINVSV